MKSILTNLGEMPELMQGHLMSALALETGVPRALLAIAAAACKMENLDEQLEQFCEPCGKPGCTCHIGNRIISKAFKEFMEHYLKMVEKEDSEDSSEIDKSFENL